MKSLVASLGPSTQKIVTRIRKVRKAADKAAKSGKRFADYKYLRSVLSAYRYFEDNGLLPHLTVIAPSVLRTPVRKKWHPLRVILEATCSRRDGATQSRWTRALEHAVAEKIDPKEMIRFIRAHNGIAGCADLASKSKPKRRPPPSGTYPSVRTNLRQTGNRIAPIKRCA